jgi:hypothetical protein
VVLKLRITKIYKYISSECTQRANNVKLADLSEKLLSAPVPIFLEDSVMQIVDLQKLFVIMCGVYQT